MADIFSSLQRKIVASGVTALALMLVFAAVAFFSWLFIQLLSLASTAIVPVVVGLFLALFLRPYYLWVKGWVKNPSLSVVVMLLSILIPLGFIIWNFGVFAVEQLSHLVSHAPEIMQRLITGFNETFPWAKQLADQFGIPYHTWFEISKIKATEAGIDTLSSLAGIVSWLVALIFFVYFLTRPTTRGRDCVRELPFLKESTKEFVAEQIDSFLDIMTSFFQRQTIICLIEGLYYGLGFLLVGLPYGFLIGFALGVLNLVPLFGTVVCLPLALPLAYFVNDGNLVRLILVVSVWAIGQFLDGYLITPKIQGNKTGLGYAGVIFSFIFWGSLFHSLLGLLLAIPLSAFWVVLWRALKSRYIKPLI